MISKIRNRKINQNQFDSNNGNNRRIVEVTLENERLQSIRDDEPRGSDDDGAETEENTTSESESPSNDSSNQIVEEEIITDVKSNQFVVNLQFDWMAITLFAICFTTRIYKLSQPNNIVFDELHYGKYVSMYMKRTFFFDQHPPLGKQLIASVAHLIANYNGNYTFSRIGAEYTTNVPIFWLRFIPALCGSLLSPCVYKLLIQMKLNRWTAVIGGLLIIFDNALLTQSRFILMESMLILFSTIGLLFLMKFHENNGKSITATGYGLVAGIFYVFALSVKFAGIFSCCLCGIIIWRNIWRLLPDGQLSGIYIMLLVHIRSIIFCFIPICIYLGLFYIHLSILTKAGPHDSVMTSAFQIGNILMCFVYSELSKFALQDWGAKTEIVFAEASLEGGLASITKGQPVKIVHGSQITLRHTHGRTCWLHSHAHVYPVRYPDKRGSSHQQQVTCYSFKDVNNWWIVKRPERDDLVVGDEPDVVKHGDEIQLVHGITSRALNSHDVAAAMTPQCQEVSCYIDYNISMPGQLLWRVQILNRHEEGDYWHAIKSQINLIHSTTGLALRFSGRQLPDWGFNQHEVVADRVIDQSDTVWNVEEHRYTKTDDQKERERQLLNAEMIPTDRTTISFWNKFVELHSKMIWHTNQVQSHMYGSEPLEWPLLSKGIAYWVDVESNGQVHLLGNIIIWYSGTAALTTYVCLLIFYLLRRRRLVFDLSPKHWAQFQEAGEIFFLGYLIHFLPYFFVERTLFLHNYLPAYVYKILLLAFMIEHIYRMFEYVLANRKWIIIYKILVFIWLVTIYYVFRRFSVLSYGTTKLTADDVVSLRWKDTWDFIIHRNLP